MSTIVTSNISDGTDTVGTEYVVNGSAKSWAEYNMTGTPSITDSLNASSITDLGTGVPQINLTAAISSANGTAWNTPAIYGTGAEEAVQSAAHITSTTTLKGICGSNTTSRNDWQKGYIGLIA